MPRLARSAMGLAGLCVLATALLTAAATPRLCARPIDLGSSVRQLVEELDDLQGAGDTTPSAPEGGRSGRPSMLSLPPVGERLRRLSRAHAIRYPFHAALGTYLEALRCDPTAVAAQWLRAAFHARSAAESDGAGDGMARSLARDPAEVTGALCEYATPGQRAPVKRALARAGLTCAGRAVT